MIARDVGIPLPRFAAWINAPAAKHLARKVDADAQVGAADRLRAEVLDHVDELIAKGVIGNEELNAADFQIATSVRAIVTPSGPPSGLGGTPGGRAGDASDPGVRHRLPRRPAACGAAHAHSPLGREDDLQGLAVVVDAIGLGGLVEGHVVGDEGRRGPARPRRAARAPDRGA